MAQTNISNNGQMSVMEAIQSRRTIFKFKPDPVPKNVLEDILYAGIWAPNHHLTEPWRFTIIGEEVKVTLAERYGEIQIEKVTSNPEAAKAATEETLAEIAERGVQKFMSKPTIVAISCVQEGNEQRQR
ncbi:MAG: nitroreductase family protein, partial [Proteobacteria bacterium]|nr:nitroreductase family protein [Pseudomonadota bacterium]